MSVTLGPAETVKKPPAKGCNPVERHETKQ